jgi:hypothetical protein
MHCSINFKYKQLGQQSKKNLLLCSILRRHATKHQQGLCSVFIRLENGSVRLAELDGLDGPCRIWKSFIELQH